MFCIISLAISQYMVLVWHILKGLIWTMLGELYYHIHNVIRVIISYLVKHMYISLIYGEYCFMVIVPTTPYETCLMNTFAEWHRIPQTKAKESNGSWT